MNANITWKDILLIVLFLLLCGLIIYNATIKTELATTQTNFLAIQDTIKTYKLKNGQLLYEKQGFILEKEELEKYIQVSEKTINELENKLDDKIALIAKLKSEIKIDTLNIIDSVFVKNDTLFSDFTYKDNWLYINGLTNCFNNDITTSIYTINMSVPITIGITENEKWLVTTENPYITFADIKGANLEKTKPKRWSLGVQAGLGIIGGAGICGSSDGIVRSGWVLGFGPYIGIGINYKFLEF